MNEKPTKPLTLEQVHAELEIQIETDRIDEEVSGMTDEDIAAAHEREGVTKEMLAAELEKDRAMIARVNAQRSKK